MAVEVVVIHLHQEQDGNPRPPEGVVLVVVPLHHPQAMVRTIMDSKAHLVTRSLGRTMTMVLLALIEAMIVIGAVVVAVVVMDRTLTAAAIHIVVDVRSRQEAWHGAEHLELIANLK